MDEHDSLFRLQGLQADLIAFAEARLPNLERLWTELEESIESFQRLLDRQRRSEKSRKDVGTDQVSIEGEDYAINEDFRQQILQVADGLDLDELEAAQLCIACQEHAAEIDRTPAFAAMLRFHEHRETLTNALRIALQQAADPDLDPEKRDIFMHLGRVVVQGSDAGPASASNYIRKCVLAMEDVEQWIRLLDNRIQGAAIIGQTLGSYDLEMLTYEKASLLRQHEHLGAILCYIVKEGYSSVDDYRFLMAKTAGLEEFSDLIVHYVPVLVSLAASMGPLDGVATLRDARALDQTFADKSEKSQWKLPDFRAAASVFWLAEYSNRYSDNFTGSPLQGVDLDKEATVRSERVMAALREGAFQFLLLICSRTRIEHWHDPAKAGLVTFLLGDTLTVRDTALSASDEFQDLLAQQLQLFVDALITNMPDTIRRLKFEEDEERRNMGLGAPQIRQEHTLHLERFLVVIGYAFQGFPDAAHEAFWSDPDGNMYGFLQWASKRQSTPRVAAFCEMFQAIARNEECADAAHKFLLDEAVGASSAKLRKGVSLNWTQIYGELTYYAGRLQDTPNALDPHAESGLATHTAEPESALMLECYMRLASHMCRNSTSAREYVLSHPDNHLHNILFDLAKSNIDSRFKACAFTTVASMLTEKLPETVSALWEVLDTWIYGVPQKAGAPKSVNSQSSADNAASSRLNPVASGFEQPFAFVRFLQALIVPVGGEDALHDSLPFPEQLGLQYRMPGINDYVDFVIGRIFKGTISELLDVDHVWELRCACLDFIATCLSTFNEDLVVFANATNINVDSAISTSSLSAYVRLHPFARVMEWMFNDGVILQLFASAHEVVEVVGATASSSPMIAALCRSIQIIDLVLKLQSTYFDIVRPIVKTQATARPKQVANPAFASFEDAILGNLRLVSDLGLYCGTSHQDLTILSLQLLQRLAVSRKLTTVSSSYSGPQAHSIRILSALQQGNDVDRITAAFIVPLVLDPRELELGDAAPGLHIKRAVLDLLNRSLESSTNRPGLAHCLLGFSCSERTVSVLAEGRFAKGASLFHAVLRLYSLSICLEESSTTSWMSAICRSAGEIIRKLIRSPLTSDIVLPELRESGFNEAIAIAQRPISPTATWTGRTYNDAEFLVSDSAPTFRDFLTGRAAYCEHSALELRAAAALNSAVICQKTKSSLLGVAFLSPAEQVQIASIFDLFDFIDLDIATPFQVPPPKYMTGLDLSVCKKEEADSGEVYDLRLVKELLLLRTAELQKSGQATDASVVQQWQDEADVILLCLESENQYGAVLRSQRDALKAWTHLVIVLLEDGQFEPAQKSAFRLQALQMVLPKLDVNLAQESPMTLPLINLVYALVQTQDMDESSATSRDANVANERLLHAFRTSLSGITSAVDSIKLRQTCYHICRHFIRTVSSLGAEKTSVARQASKMVENAGERLIDIVCEDVLSSSNTCKVAALLMLEACVQLFQTVKTPYMVRAMTRSNFVAVLVDGIRTIPSEFQQDRSSSDLQTVLASIHTSLALLLRLSQDSDGAAAVLDAGIFSSIRDSQLFATDPDIGLEIDNPEALENFYRLLVAVLRIVNSIVLVKGPRNKQITGQGRNFLTENRQCMQSVFKTANRSEKMSAKNRQSLEELVDYFTVLIAATDFLGFDEKPTSRRSAIQAFT